MDSSRDAGSTGIHSGWARARWALLLGNFVTGCGVMVVAGTLHNLTVDLDVSVPVGGQLIAVAAVMMSVGAPLLAALLSGWDRRRLLALAMLWYAIGHAACALAPDYASLLPLRALTVLSAAVFTPQAAAAVGHLAPPARRGQAITFIFLGWSVASVLGMPLASWVGERWGWRSAMWGVSGLALIAAVAVWKTVAPGVRPTAMSLKAWRGVLTHPVWMAVVAVTALQSAGQQTIHAYAVPYFHQVLRATPEQISLFFSWLGACGLAGNMLLSRHVDRIGPARAVAFTLCLIAFGLLAWPLGVTIGWLALLVTPWALGGFATNSAQQARLVQLAPAYAPALMALNTSAIYMGHAAGAASGGALLAATGGFDWLHWVALLWVVLAWVISRWAARREARSRHAAMAPA
ncbi:MAG: MFS transporter [Pseudomonadota bacterium]